MTISNSYGNAVINHLFGTASLSVPTGLYLAVGSSPFAETSPHGDVEPATADGYARIEINNSGVGQQWTTSTAKTLHNAYEFAFNAATDDWSTMSYYAILDSPTRNIGTPYITGALLPTRIVYNGDSLKWPSGTFVISVQ